MENLSSFWSTKIAPFLNHCGLLQAPPPDILQRNSKIGGIAKVICEVKAENKETLLNSAKVRYLGSCFIDGDLGQIFGDIGNVIFSALSIAQICKPSLAASASFSWANCVLGSVGGVLNVGVGLYCLKSARQMQSDLTPEGKKYIEEHGTALSFIYSMKGDAPEEVQKYYRMLWDGIFMVGIGGMMTLVSLSVKVAALAPIGTFLATNPWILPLLWFLITVPLLIEVARGNKNIWNGTDLAGAMELDKLKKILESENGLSEIRHSFTENPSETNPLKKICLHKTDNELIEHENKMMQELQANIGVEAAIEAMRLRALLLEEASIQEKIKPQIEKLEAKIAEWHRAQRCRLIQQSLLITSFALSMIGLWPQVPQKAIGIATNGVILIGNLIPLGMDIFWPFTRNCPIVVDKADVDAVKRKIQTAQEAYNEEEIA